MRKPTIHSKPEEIQAYHTERGADSLELSNTKLDIINSDIVAGNQDITQKLIDVTHVTEDNLKDVSNLTSISNAKLAEIKKETTQTVALLQTLLKTVKDQTLSLELGGLEKIIIESDPNLAREGSESNKLLKSLLAELEKPTKININLELE